MSNHQENGSLTSKPPEAPRGIVYDPNKTHVPAPVIDDVWLFGTVDRTLSEMKYILDHPDEFDAATWQTLKHHLEDLSLFIKYAEGKMVKLGKIASLPPVAVQGERGY